MTKEKRELQRHEGLELPHVFARANHVVGCSGLAKSETCAWTTAGWTIFVEKRQPEVAGVGRMAAELCHA
jgi:hypothetical protein